MTNSRRQTNRGRFVFQQTRCVNNSGIKDMVCKDVKDNKTRPSKINMMRDEGEMEKIGDRTDERVREVCGRGSAGDEGL